MGRVEAQREEEDLKTVDLSIERGYRMDIPEESGIEVGKIHGIGARGNQEDAFGVSDSQITQFVQKGMLLILADGMGGMASGEVASTTTVISCLQFFDNKTPEEINKSDEWIEEMVFDANEKTIEAMGEDAGMGGATLVGLHVDNEERARWITVGDSHLYLFRDGELKLLNREHIFMNTLNELVELGEISREDADHHPKRKALTSFVGKPGMEEIDKGEIVDLRSGDWIILMSDGIFGTISDEEIVSALQFGAGKAALQISMLVEAKQKVNQDNYTGLLVHIL